MVTTDTCQKTSGFSIRELALVQPSYPGRPSLMMRPPPPAKKAVPAEKKSETKVSAAHQQQAVQKPVKVAKPPVAKK
jgi:hypothetical protein